jgi:hypothetical protein
LVLLHERGQRLRTTSQHINGFVPVRPGVTHEKTPETRKSDWLVVRRDWMPAVRDDEQGHRNAAFDERAAYTVDSDRSKVQGFADLLVRPCRAKAAAIGL